MIRPLRRAAAVCAVVLGTFVLWPRESAAQWYEYYVVPPAAYPVPVVPGPVVDPAVPWHGPVYDRVRPYRNGFKYEARFPGGVEYKSKTRIERHGRVRVYEDWDD